MTIPEAPIVEGGSNDPPTVPDPPPIPALPATGQRREQVLRSYAERTVDRLGVTATLWLIAELEEAVADARERVR
jgi:hypothetical protein